MVFFPEINLQESDDEDIEENDSNESGDMEEEMDVEEELLVDGVPLGYDAENAEISEIESN